MNKKFKHPLSTSSWDNEEIIALRNVISNGQFTMGKEVKKFEKNFANFFKSKYAVMVNSGSSANLLMIASLFYTKKNPLKKGDEVIVPAVSWSTSYFPLFQYGLKIKFVDIDLYTLNYDLKSLKKAISNKTKLILAVNLLGNPNNFDEINHMVEKKNIQIVEDNCESMGAKFDNKMTGTFGRLGTFSTFFSHHMSTMEGGLVITDDEELYHILLCLRAHGWTRDLPKKNKLKVNISNDKFKESFRFILPGYNLRPLEMSGAIGSEQLKKLKSFIKIRRKNADYFKQVLKGNTNIIIQKEIGKSSWFGFSLLINPNSKLSRKELLNKLYKLGIECRPIVTGNFANNPVVNYFDYSIHSKLKNSNYVDANGLFIGNHHYDISHIIEKLSIIR